METPSLNSMLLWLGHISRYTSSSCSDPILTSLASPRTFQKSKTDKTLCSRCNTNETKARQYSPETGDLPTSQQQDSFFRRNLTQGAQLCHSIAYILLILLTYIASCIVFCQIRAKSSSDMEDFRTIVTLAPDLVTVSRFWNRHQSFVVNSFRAKSSAPFTFGQGPES